MIPGSTDNSKAELDKATKDFFNVFNNKGQRELNLDLIRILCIPEITIIKKAGLNQEVYNLETFIAPRVKILSDGTLTDFEEAEIEEQTTITGNTAQRHTRYQKSGYQNGSYFKAFGTKFFHFIRTANGWKITSLIWEDD